MDTMRIAAMAARIARTDLSDNGSEDYREDCEDVVCLSEYDKDVAHSNDCLCSLV